MECNMLQKSAKPKPLKKNQNLEILENKQS